MPTNYDKKVFVNCPLDDEYKKLLDAIVFAIYDCGFIPRHASQQTDSGETRFDKIKRLIRESRFGVHDISRVELDAKTKLPRFNMPLELGVFIGAIAFGSTRQRKKKTLILDTQKYRYQKFISDIAGQDIRAHGNDIVRIINHIRDWLNEASSERTIPSGKLINQHYSDFLSDLSNTCDKLKLNVADLSAKDYCTCIEFWLKEYA